MAKKAKTQAALFIVASIADLVLTLWGTAQVGYGTTFTEINPIARSILTTGGPLGLSAFKVSGVILVLVLTAILASDDRTWVRRVARLLLLLGALLAAGGAWCWVGYLS